ncbi:MAG: phosphoserine phosphatase SerB [Pseudomonadota bacterium]
MSDHNASAAEVAGAFSSLGIPGFVAVLTAAAARGLSDREIDRAVHVLAAEDNPSRRLGPAAAEIALSFMPARGDVDWPTILPGVDVNVVPVAHRRKRLLIADMDSTMIPVECIDELADMAGVGAEVAAITERAMAGELDFEGALTERVALLAGAEVALLERVFAERIALNPGARALVRTMAAAGAHTMLVSGGFTFFTERVAAVAGFAENRANTLEMADGRLTGRAVPPILGRAAKQAALEEALAALGLTPAEAMAVGDGANDLAMVEAAGLGVAFRAKPRLADAADARIDHAGLEALLALQGYAADELAAD